MWGAVSIGEVGATLALPRWDAAVREHRGVQHFPLPLEPNLRSSPCGQETLIMTPLRPLSPLSYQPHLTKSSELGSLLIVPNPLLTLC